MIDEGKLMPLALRTQFNNWREQGKDHFSYVEYLEYLIVELLKNPEKAKKLYQPIKDLTNA